MFTREGHYYLGATLVRVTPARMAGDMVFDGITAPLRGLLPMVDGLNRRGVALPFASAAPTKHLFSSHMISTLF